MNGLVWKALRREWFVLRWLDGAWIAGRRGLLYARWAVRDAARWLLAGWGSNWIRWRWAGLASAGTILAAGVAGLLRPVMAVVRNGMQGVSDEDRKWVFPAVTGTIGLLLLALLFLHSREPGTAVAASPPPIVEDPPEPPQRLVEPPPPVEDRLRDPFADLEPPPLGPQPLEREPFEPVPEPEPIDEEPSLVITPEPEPVELGLDLDRGPIEADWQPRLSELDEVHVASAARTIEPIELGDVPYPVDGWDRHRPRIVDPHLTHIAHTVREYALATASTTFVAGSKPIPRRAPEPELKPVEPPPVEEPVLEEPVEEEPAPEPRFEFEPEPAPAEEEQPAPAKITLEAVPGGESASVGESSVLDLVVSNVGGTRSGDLVVRIDLPEQLRHRLGSAIDFPVGTLEPGESRDARLVTEAVRAGEAVYRVSIDGVRIEGGDEPAELAPRIGVVPRTVTRVTPRRSLPPSPPTLRQCCPAW